VGVERAAAALPSIALGAALAGSARAGVSRAIDLEAPEAPRRWSDAAAARPTRARFALEVGGIAIPYRVLALPVLPGQEVPIRSSGEEGGALVAAAAGGHLVPTGKSRWTWVAPSEPGFHAVRVVSREARDTIDLTFMVMHPADHVREGTLHGYAIGRYQPRSPWMSPAYDPPAGFVEVRPETANILVSPSLRLGQFLCKQPGEPAYMAASPLLLIQLEAILEALRESGHATRGLAVMSGFRTPIYNRAIGNTTDFSRHLWGDAADVYVDDDGDGRMDDLDGDGRIGVEDARWLARVAERVMTTAVDVPDGGVAAYPATATHGPFVHVDARGTLTRW
jgi:hypothetical protein